MAGGFYGEKEHAFITIERDIRSGEIPKAVLLCGSEDYLIKWYTDTIVKKYVAEACMPLDLIVLEEGTLTIDKVREGLETVSLMSERKIVLLPDFAPAAGGSLKGFSEADVRDLAAYLDMIPDGSMLLITVSEDEDTRPRKNKIRTAIEKKGKVYDFQPLNDRQLRSFIEKRFRTAGKSCTNRVMDMIISESGYGNKAIEYSLYNMENDLKKIIAHSGKSSDIGAEDVREVLSHNPENNVFAMLDAIGRGRKDEALRLLHNLLDSGTPVYNLLRLITNQLELILSVKEMKEEGASPDMIQRELGVHRFRVKKAMAVTGKYSMDDLKKALSGAYEVDHNIKTGLFDSTLALEYFIARM